MLQVTASDAFGHEATDVAADVTGAAFAALGAPVTGK
jgi:hypothetical protein